MDLIDRTNLPRTVTFCSETEHDIGFEEGMQSIIDEINDAPTVDAVPIARLNDLRERWADCCAMCTHMDCDKCALKSCIDELQEIIEGR